MLHVEYIHYLFQTKCFMFNVFITYGINKQLGYSDGHSDGRHQY